MPGKDPPPIAGRRPAGGAYDDTIAAIASAPGGAARGIVRVAGPDVVAIMANCFRASDGRILSEIRLPTRLNGHVELTDLGKRRLPCELYLWPTERSYCRAPMAEIHTLGSPPLLSALMRLVCQSGARAAAPGEFTLRAFLGGRIDLAQAEAVLGVIDARGARDFQTALAQLSGGLSQPLTQLRERLLENLAQLEAGLDFVEEDIECISAATLDSELSAALTQVEELAAQMSSRTDSAQTVTVVLRGRPNAGKSSLFNALVERYGATATITPALVSAKPGTTRDYLRAVLTLSDVECELIDTAGLETEAVPAGPARDAQAQSRQQLARADITIYCLDASKSTTGDDVQSDVLQEGDVASDSVLVALTKCDLPRCFDRCQLGGLPWVETSAATGTGLEDLARAVREAAGAAGVRESSIVSATAQRCRDSLDAAAAALKEGRRLLEADSREELLAAEIRTALIALGHVTGAVYTDDILDRIFSRFCIGK